MHLLLIRHAQTPSNVLGLLDSGTPGPDLTELGERQAAAIPGVLSGRPVTSIQASTMVRTQQTARPLAEERGLNVSIHDGLKEIEAGDVEMRSDLPSLRSYLGVIWSWATGDLSPRMPGAQNGVEFFDRFDAVVDEVMARGEELPVIVSHGASIRVWAGLRCDNVGPSFGADTELHNTGTVLVDRTSAGWQLLEWHEDPLGGPQLGGKSGPDPTGETVAEAEEHASS